MSANPEAGAPLDAVDEMFAAFGPELFERLNVDFEDSLLLVGRVLGDRPGATRTLVTAIDRYGVDALVTDADGDHEHRVEFSAPIEDPSQMTERLFGLVTLARERSGEEGTTTAERELATLSGLRTMLTTVSAVADVHPHLRRITFQGGDLATFAPVGPDTFLYVLLPPVGRTELTIDQGFTWEAYAHMDPAEQPVGAYYTLRQWRPETQELDMLFVLHGDTGPASAWAGRAAVGDPVALWGPRTAFEPPTETEWYLLVADETGLPAVAGILESLPPGTTAHVFAEVDNPAEQQALPTSPSFHVTWCYREGAEAGTTTLLPDAVRALPWPGGTPYVWGGGESRIMTAVRKYVRREVGLEREAVSLVAYWRHKAHEADPTDDE